MKSIFRAIGFIAFAAALLACHASAQQYPTYPPPPYPPPGYPQQQPYPQQRYPQRRYPDRSSSASVAPYAMFSAAHYSGQGVGNGTAPTQSGGITALGGTFGVYTDFRNPGPIRAGFDARLLIGNSANSTTYGNKILGGLVGLRIDGSGAHLPATPYFQLEIGGVGTNNGTQTTRTASFAYQAQFGADIPILAPALFGRIEYGAGQLTDIDNTNHTLQTFSAGLVFRIN